MHSHDMRVCIVHIGPLYVCIAVCVYSITSINGCVCCGSHLRSGWRCSVQGGIASLCVECLEIDDGLRQVVDPSVREGALACRVESHGRSAWERMLHGPPPRRSRRSPTGSASAPSSSQPEARAPKRAAGFPRALRPPGCARTQGGPRRAATRGGPKRADASEKQASLLEVEALLTRV